MSCGCSEKKLWAAALLFYGAGDLLTTHYGLQEEHVEEASPVSRRVLQAGGTGGMVGLKLGVFVAFWILYQRAPEEWAKGVPLGRNSRSLPRQASAVATPGTRSRPSD